ncbi:phosphotransferase family protein [Chitinophaga vietnamensis]|uniref:phosphotransferase family protein n=1 Tax=Chitinophaga vietnamensis TaxID=2593957 RepID=UPI001178794D|nr:phosphotransferase [Chitinophaga vietnamensis]
MDSDTHTAAALSDIHRNFPQLDTQVIRFCGEGMDSRAFELNHSLIFRFPKYDHVAEQLRVERCLLPRLRSHVSVAIPDFSYFGYQQENGLPFAGYEKINGIPLTDIRRLPSPELINDIAAFIRQVHAFPVADALACNTNLIEQRSHYEELLEIAQTTLYPHIEAHSYVETLFHDYLSEEKNFVYTPVLLHADLSADHIFIDPATQRLSGIIDFGDVCIGDPDFDLMYLYAYPPAEGFLQQLLAYYPHHDTIALLKKLDFFARCNTIEDVLTGIERKDDAILSSSMAQFKAEAASYVS